MIQFTQGSKAMDIRPIVTDDDYEAALTEIKRLWSAEAGSPEAQKIEVLAMLAQSFERAREPLSKANPIGSPRSSAVSAL